jgi:hypothetical protein
MFGKKHFEQLYYPDFDILTAEGILSCPKQGTYAITNLGIEIMAEALGYSE